MRILTRYILGEISSHSLIGCALFTFILLMKPLEQILDMVVRNSSSFEVILQVFLFTLPNLFLVSIPMAVLVGVLLGLSRLAADSEITAMRASGLGIWYFVRVASIVAILGTSIGLLNSLYVIPKANQAILELQRALETSQASFEIQPRVFYEEFKDAVIYVENVLPGTGVSNWRRVFMADTTDPSSPRITTAQSATVTPGNAGKPGAPGAKDTGLLIRLRNVTDHEMNAQQPGQYNISTFAQTDRPLDFSPQSDVQLGRLDTPIYALGNSDLLRLARAPDGKRYQIEFQRRLAFPAACIVLMLIGVPLGAASRRGGKSSGFVITLLLVVIYYLLSNFGIAWAKQGKLSAIVGVWLANVLFAAAGLFLLSQLASGGSALNAITSLFARRHKAQPAQEEATVLNQEESRQAQREAEIDARYKRRYKPDIAKTLHRFKPRGFPLILDEYVLSEFLKMFAMVLSGFVVLMLVFTAFELIGDMIRNHIPTATLGAYLLNLTPSMIYQITPLAVLLAVLVTFSLLQRSSELVAMKATGISIYRLVIPVFIIAAILSCALFAFDQYYLPQANRRQEALRNVIKGRPAQTTLNPNEKWIFGQQHNSEPDHIFYYQFFDPDEDAFANLSLFEFDAATFGLTKRIFAARAAWNPATRQWDFENGWVRTMHGADQTGFREFQHATFADMQEDPGYFKKEALQSQEMNFAQLRHYIGDLQQSGFDTMRLRVQLNRKIADPLAAVVMAILAVPFALTMGRRGGLTGVASAIGIAACYWVLLGLFGAMGSGNLLPAYIAAWTPDILFGLTGGYLLLRTPT